MRDTTVVSPSALLLFGGTISVEHKVVVYLCSWSYLKRFALVDDASDAIVADTHEVQAGLVTVDQWLQMHAPAQTAVYFKELRLALDSLLHTRIGVPRVS